jgi:hypothetical protein
MGSGFGLSFFMAEDKALWHMGYCFMAEAGTHWETLV